MREVGILRSSIADTPGAPQFRQSAPVHIDNRGRDDVHCALRSGCRATGKPVQMRGMTWLRVREGKIVESWDCWNLGALMQYLSSES